MFLKKFQENFTFPTYFVITCLCIFCINLKINARILRMSCFSYGDFNYIKNNEALRGTSIASFQDLTVEACQDQCIFNPHCKSFNIHGNGTCHLFNVSAADPTDKSTMISKQGWTYISTNYSDRLVGRNCRELDPCGENYLCKDTCQCPGFECISCDMVPGGCIATPQLKTFTIKHYSDLCVSYRASNNRLLLDSSCNDKFALTPSKNLMHVQSGKCVVPEGSNDDARIGLSSDCKDLNSWFEQTAAFSMKHVSTGKCVHPYLGSISPSLGTEIVIFSGCNENRLQFKFIYDQN